MSEAVPARVDRQALERIIKRAAELQTAEREIGDTLTSDELISLGREALLEERAHLGQAGVPGILDRVAGPGEVTAQRVVSLDSEMVEQELIRWMERPDADEA